MSTDILVSYNKSHITEPGLGAYNKTNAISSDKTGHQKSEIIFISDRIRRELSSPM